MSTRRGDVGRRVAARLGTLFVAAVFAAACDKVPLGAPTASTITVSAQSSTVAPGGSTQITAVVIESAGTPVHDGTLVRFSASLGTLDPPESETRGGIATTTFVAGTTSGTAQIRATSGAAGAGSGGTPTNLVEIQIGAAAASSMSVTASPSRVPSSGGTVTVMASASDASGNRLVGIPITFSTTSGTLSASSATTDSNGDATVTLTTNRDATVTARAGNQTATANVTVGTAPTVSLTVAPANPLAGTPVTLTITPASTTMPRVVVNWGDGTVEDMGVVAAVRTASHTYNTAGTFTIAATASADGETFNTSTSVSVAAGVGITLGDPTPSAPVEGTPVSVTVNPATPGTSPRVVINWGDGQTEDLGLVSSQRGVTHTYQSAGSFIITATATAGGQTFSTSKAVTVSARPPLSVVLTDNRSGSPDRCQPVLFTATVSQGETIRQFEWTIDSNVDSEDARITTTGNQLTRVFDTAGLKTISVSAETPDGRTGNGQTQVVVKTTPVTCP